MISRHETCLEYFKRRLSEGWKCISLEGYKAVLLSPEGIRRELDLRNDVETLRPNAAGDETNLGKSGDTDNWKCVDEDPPDEDATRVYCPATSYLRDLYNITNHSEGSGTINFVKVWMRIRSQKAIGEGDIQGKVAIKSGGVVDEGDEETENTDTYQNFSHQWNTPPEGGTWDWDKIDALQIGVALKRIDGTAYCTQVYVEVDYTPPLPLPSSPDKSATMGAKMIAGKLI